MPPCVLIALLIQSCSHYDDVPRDLASREREIGAERRAFSAPSPAPAAQGGRGPVRNENGWLIHDGQSAQSEARKAPDEMQPQSAKKHESDQCER